MNKVIIIGNLTADPELRTVNTADGPAAVCTFTVAATGKKRDSDTVFFRCSAWRGLADLVAKYTKKGAKVAVTGPVTGRAYKDRDGNARASLEVTVENFEFCERKEQKGDADDSGLMDVGNGIKATVVESEGELPF